MASLYKANGMKPQPHNGFVLGSLRHMIYLECTYTFSIKYHVYKPAVSTSWVNSHLNHCWTDIQT